MSRIYLVRHGRAAAGWTEDADPDLDDVGRDQVAGMTLELMELGPLHLVTSPLRRARSTAVGLERAWGVEAVVEPRVGEIPSPSGPDGQLENRGPWLGRVMRSRWDDADLEPALRDWRQGVIDALLGMADDTVVTTHFVAINAAIGEATGDGRVTCFRPDNCSYTIFDAENGRLKLVERGREATTNVG